MASHFLPCKEPSPDVSPPTPERDLVTLAQKGMSASCSGPEAARGLEHRLSVQAESEICLTMVMRQTEASACLQV